MLSKDFMGTPVFLSPSAVNIHAMSTGVIRAICFDLDNTLWEIEPVLVRAERILADWLGHRYPRIGERFTAADMLEVRAALLAEQPHQAHDLSFLRRETLARCAAEVGYERDISHEAFAIWHAARNQVEPYVDVISALETLKARFRLATLTNGNADLAVIGLAHHFEVTLHAAALGCAKPDPRAYTALANALTLEPAEILFVGDEPHADVVGPRAAGMQTVWVNRGGAIWPDELPAADASVADLDGLMALLVEKL
jgi:2-haloalkanoic acid dehalogenase type II